ncbi:Kinesin-like protein [Hondaea fermentalgiana]|uniref:Kinesin-like protein n=1 Tax=Hondaea fermentalgiana TaxID=2315210 RepID=A0A2R5GGI7_9STRA|nr:Kinesin-like protein [Hondaea fermentalgiana]|eukprot:GBG29997.1 Kinesin-like protein [Hondaea fermentalgiana]
MDGMNSLLGSVGSPATPPMSPRLMRRRKSSALEEEMSSIRVAVRVRPFSKREKAAGARRIVEMHGNSTVLTDPTMFLHLEENGGVGIDAEMLDNDDVWRTQFTFDRCFWSFDRENPNSKYATQREVFDTYGPWIIENAAHGFNCSLFAYGQTGSGKTHTMMGNDVDISANGDAGFIPRLCSGIFKEIHARSSAAAAAGSAASASPGASPHPDDVDISSGGKFPPRTRHTRSRNSSYPGFGELSGFGNTTHGHHAGTSADSGGSPNAQGGRKGHSSFHVEASYFEIYNERVFDLLNPNNKMDAAASLRVREHPKTGAYVEDLLTIAVSSYHEIEELLKQGSMARRVAETRMNKESSRSHAVFQLVLRKQRDGSDAKRIEEQSSKLYLVDLAGSERVSASGATGARLKEAANINRSLSALSDVIKALTTPRAADTTGKQFVPYRNSALTWLLKESLGGNAKTVMLATVSPDAVNYHETLSTLKYAERAKKIVNKARVNKESSAALVEVLQQEILQLREQLARYESESNDVLSPCSRTLRANQNDVDRRKLLVRLESQEKLVSSLSTSWEQKRELAQEHFAELESQNEKLQRERAEMEAEMQRLRSEKVARDAEEEKRRIERQQRQKQQIEQQLLKRKQEQNKQQSAQRELEELRARAAVLEEALATAQSERDAASEECASTKRSLARVEKKLAKQTQRLGARNSRLESLYRVILENQPRSDETKLACGEGDEVADGEREAREGHILDVMEEDSLEDQPHREGDSKNTSPTIIDGTESAELLERSLSDAFLDETIQTGSGYSAQAGDRTGSEVIMDNGDNGDDGQYSENDGEEESKDDVDDHGANPPSSHSLSSSSSQVAEGKAREASRTSKSAKKNQKKNTVSASKSARKLAKKNQKDDVVANMEETLRAQLVNARVLEARCIQLESYRSIVEPLEEALGPKKRELASVIERLGEKLQKNQQAVEDFVASKSPEHHPDQRQDDIETKLENKLEKTQTELALATQHLHVKEQESELLRRESTSLREQVEKASSEHRQLQERVEELSREVESKAAAAQKVAYALELKEAAVQELEQELAQFREDAQTSKDLLETLQKEVAEARSACTTSDTQLREAQDAREAAEQAETELTESLQEAEERASESAAALGELRATAAQLREDLAARTKSVDELSTQLTKAHEETAQFKEAHSGQIRDLQDQVRSLEADKSALMTRIDKAQADLEATKSGQSADSREWEARYAEKDSEIEELEEQLRAQQQAFEIERKELNLSVATALSQLSVLQGNFSVLEKSNRSANAARDREVDAYESRIETLSRDKALLEGELRGKVDECDRWRTSEMSAIKTNSRLEMELLSVKDQVAFSQETETKLRDHIASLTKAKQEISQQLHTIEQSSSHEIGALKRSLRELQSETEALRQQLENERIAFDTIFKAQTETLNYSTFRGDSPNDEGQKRMEKLLNMQTKGSMQ